MIEESLVTLLNAHAGVQAQFGSVPRIYPDQAPAVAAYPLATMFRVSHVPISGIRMDTAWVHARVQYTVYAPTRLAARNAADQIKDAFKRIRATVGPHAIDDIRLIDERDSFADDPHPVGFSAVELDFEIYFQE